jgi:hypothetical protein
MTKKEVVLLDKKNLVDKQIIKLVKSGELKLGVVVLTIFFLICVAI